MFSIREFRADDAREVAVLFYEVVQNGTRAFYDQQQRRVWAPAPREPAFWVERLSRGHTWVSSDDEGVSGFMTVDDTGYIDMAYVRTDRLGKGDAAQLYNVVEAFAKAQATARLTTQASELAKRFFIKRGWTVDKRLEHEREGVVLVNYAMHKQLLASAQGH